MIWAAVSSQSCFCWLYRASPSLATEYNQFDFGVDHLVMSMCGVFFLCCWKKVFAMTSAFSWQNSISLFPASFHTPRPNLPVTPAVSSLSFAHTVRDHLRPGFLFFIFFGLSFLICGFFPIAKVTLVSSMLRSFSHIYHFVLFMSLAAKNIINLISVLTIWWCSCVESSLVLLERERYDQCILLAELY